MQGFKTIKVSCGGGFTLALVENDSLPLESAASSVQREVVSWGRVSNGRLGTGKPKREVKKNAFGGNEVQAPKRYQCEPTIIPNLLEKRIVDISAGMDHSLALSEIGEVFAWGSNALGQCAAVEIDPLNLRKIELQRHRERYNGIKEQIISRIWDDVWLPRLVPHFDPSSGAKIESICAGGIHSAAIDEEGLVYTWGGGGNSNCLGHGESSSYEFGKSEKKDSLRRHVLTNSGYLRVPKWAIPRCIKSLKNEKISKIFLGRAHVAAISRSGDLFMWGDEAMDIQKVRQI